MSAAAYTDNGVTNGQTYYYTVTSTNPVLGAESPQSSEVSALPRCATSSVAYQTTLLSAAPYAYWRLNETSGTIANDYLGAFNGTYGNAVVLGTAGPRPADFLGFELTNTAALFSNNINNSSVTLPALNLNTNTVTITAWLYPIGGQASYTGLVFCRSGTTTAGMNYNGAGTDLGYTWNNDGNTWGWNSGVQPPANQWSFVALSLKANSATVYLKNASGQQTATNILSHPNQAFGGTGTVGTDTYSAAARTFNGIIDEVAVFNYAMSPAQVQQLYDEGHQLTQVQLGAQRSGGNLNLTWPQGTLFQADNVTGPWLRVTNAVSPFTVASNVPARFFRVLLQQ